MFGECYFNVVFGLRQVIFWHHRLCHNPGVNYVGQNIRAAALFDFIKARHLL